MVTRLFDWEERLHDYLAAQEGAEFVWGKNDCALFAAGAVQAMTGEDPATAYRGRYTTAAGSVRALKRYGAGTLVSTIDALFPQRDPGFARRGDLVMVDGMVGVCVGADAVFIGEQDEAPGLVRFGRDRWVKAWSVG
ncbi:hypothetical protein GCM10011380_00730 [Sphingomonas metalli]|uniref:DUF6950 domain-containing protein n=1 Tax=Sphingomonas metalli TaxID=1779358 RepID=A0A916SV98_9SPHN|nr:hypothetical protein [Sphingomonas metalli]GGB15175.1 hypothetical protein GCM10011380_00730 [Sphingomonas metalli]